MGVWRLLSHCLEHRDECVEMVNLVKEAQSRNGIEILLDFYSFEHFIVRHLWSSAARVSHNPILRLLGGEYKLFDEAFRKLYTDLKDLGITLVVFRDGAKGSCKVMVEQKLDTWRSRHKRDMQKLYQLLGVISGRTSMVDVPEEVAVRPVLLEVQIVRSLRAAGCEVIECATGEADYVLASSLHQRPKAMAVFSNDSDFAIFKGCAFIPNALFDTENDLCLGEDELLPRKPTDRLMVGIIRSERVAPMLQLAGHEDLVELSIIAGNDFTSSFLSGPLRGKFDLTSTKLMDAVKWVRKYRRAENHPAISQYMKLHPDFSLRVTRSRLFYAMGEDTTAEDLTEKHYLTRFIEDQIKHGHYPSNVISMHLRFYWYRMLLEDSSQGEMSCEAALSELRSHIYSMVLREEDRYVVEYGQGSRQAVATQHVYRSNMRGLPQVTAIDPNKIFQNLRTFSRVMTHYEPYLNPRYIERYGRKTGFVLYVLRYFLQLNVGYNLHVGQDEALAVVAMALGRVDPAWYLSLAVQPTLRSVTMGNMFQDVYRYAYHFLGSLLHLRSEFPEPWEIFSGAVWTAFYVTGEHRGGLLDSGFSPDHVRRIEKEKQTVIHEHRHILGNVFEGFFPFKHRF